MQPLAVSVPSGEIRYLKLPKHLVLMARGDWSRDEDAFSNILDKFGITDTYLHETAWTYSWDEANDCDIWMIALPAAVVMA